MKTLLLIMAFSLGAFAQDQLKCSFEINDNESKFKGLKKSKLDFQWEVSNGQRFTEELDFVKLVINPESEKSYKHKVVIFEKDRDTGKYLGEENIDYRGFRLEDKLRVYVERQGVELTVEVFDGRNKQASLRLIGPVTDKVSVPLFVAATFKDLKRSFPIFGKKKEGYKHKQIQVMMTCQKLDRLYVIDSDLQEKFEFEEAVQEARESAGSQAQQQ